MKIESNVFKMGLVMSASLVFAFAFSLGYYKSDSKTISTPSPSPAITKTITPTIVPQVEGVITESVQKKENTPTLINCTGPDGKTFQTTQKECDEFNTSWDKKNPATSTPATTNTFSYNCPGSDVVCTHLNMYNKLTTYTVHRCTYDEAYKACEANKVKENCLAEAFVKNEECSTTCKTKNNEDKLLCEWAYGPNGTVSPRDLVKFEECLNEVSSNYGSCLNTCSNNYELSLKTCGNN